jgi:hypothetical protein
MPRPFLACLLSLSVTLTGCASLLNAGPSPVQVVVEPPAAVVTVTRDDGRLAATLTGPANVLALDKAHDYGLRIDGAGYRGQDLRIGRQVAPAFWGNVALLLGGLALQLPGLTAVDNSGLSAGLTLLLGVPIVLLAGGAAMLVDWANGTMWAHDRTDVRVVLEPQHR